MTSTDTQPETGERAFSFLRLNERPPKPRTRGVTEIRGPYYTPLGRRYLKDLLETMGVYVDTLKYAGGSFALMPREAVRGLNGLCHEHEVEVSTGGFLEYVLTQREDAVARYLEECRELAFDIVEISSGFVTLPVDDLVRLTKAVRKVGLKPKPEVGIQFGAGGASRVEALEAEGTRDVGQAIDLAKRHLDAGAHMIMIESEGITEQVREWRTDVVARIVSDSGSSTSCSRRPTPTSFPGTSRTMGSTSTCSSITARSSSSSACAPASGAPRTPGAGCSPTASEVHSSHPGGLTAGRVRNPRNSTSRGAR
jgi:phosphosulfolactate synthase (CoM biosynthesis protein A)